jgi:hypothetical protein
MRCPDCGEATVEELLHMHQKRACPGPGNASLPTCPMCGERFERYLQHLHTCPAGERADQDRERTEVAGTGEWERTL